MKHLAIAWNVLLALIYVVVVIGILSVAESRFETLVLAGLIELYAAVLYSFSLQGESAEIDKNLNQIGEPDTSAAVDFHNQLSAAQLLLQLEQGDATFRLAQMREYVARNY